MARKRVLSLAEFEDLLPLYQSGLLEQADALLVEQASETYVVGGVRHIQATLPPRAGDAVLASRLCKLLALPLPEAQALLVRLVQARPQPTHVELALLKATPQWSASVVRLAPQATLASATRVAPESVLILRGTLEDVAGKTYDTGDEVFGGVGTTHTLRNIGSDIAVWVSVAYLDHVAAPS